MSTTGRPTAEMYCPSYRWVKVIDSTAPLEATKTRADLHPQFNDRPPKLAAVVAWHEMATTPALTLVFHNDEHPNSQAAEDWRVRNPNWFKGARAAFVIEVSKEGV